MWRIRSLHLSRTEAQYVTPHLAEGVPWEDMWARMQQLAQPTSEGIEATPGEGIKLYGAVCPLPKRLQHLYLGGPICPGAGGGGLRNEAHSWGKKKRRSTTPQLHTAHNE